MKSVMVTGAGGYIGTCLVDHLLAKGHRVVGLDRYYFGKDLLGPDVRNNQRFQLVQKDIRELTVDDFKDIDVVMDLAGLSNDPTCDLKPQLTYSINLKGGMHVADMAKAAGVKRYIFSSSCSVYGQGAENRLTETSELAPQSSYARGKVDVENHLRQIMGADFGVTVLRHATVYGLAKRMRFDLIINLMTLKAWRERRIFVLGGGKQWRPLVHVQDVARAFLLVMESDIKKVAGQVFNVGSNEQNYQVFQVANMVKELLPTTEILLVPDDPDRRTYNVAFDKISRDLDFKTQFTARDGIREIEQALSYGALDPDDRRSRTIEHYKFLLQVEETMAELGRGGRIF